MRPGYLTAMAIGAAVFIATLGSCPAKSERVNREDQRSRMEKLVEENQALRRDYGELFDQYIQVRDQHMQQSAELVEKERILSYKR